MTTWVEKNKGFLLTFLAIMVPVVLSSGYFLSDILYLKASAAENKETIKVECKRSQEADVELRTQIAELRGDIKYLKNNSEDVKDSVKATNTKLDWLIQQQIKAHDN